MIERECLRYENGLQRDCLPVFVAIYLDGFLQFFSPNARVHAGKVYKRKSLYRSALNK